MSRLSWLTLTLVFTGAAAAQPAPGPFHLVSMNLTASERITRTDFDYTYQVVAQNGGAGACLSVTATVSSTVVATQIVDGSLDFGAIAAGQTATSLDTFTLRQDRTRLFNASALRFTFHCGNQRPVANAGLDKTARVGDTVTLDGSSSYDPDGNPLTFRWTLTSRPPGSTAVLSSATAVRPTFVVDATGQYVWRLVVNDGTADSDADSVTITTTNTRPVANAGPDQTVEVGDTVTLDGSASYDVDGNPLSFLWTMTARPAGSAAVLSNPRAVKPTLIADKAGSYTLRLVVNDGQLDSLADFAIIGTSNTRPVADAGRDQTVALGSTVQLDGSGSSDVDGDPLTFRWSMTSMPAGSAATISSGTAVRPTMIADRPGIYVLQLIVNDGKTDSLADTVSVSTDNTRPVAKAGPDQKVTVGAAVTLDGSGSTDPDGDPLTFKWSLSSKPVGSLAALSNLSAVKPAFTADKPGVYVAQLIVNDGKLDSEPSRVTISTENLPPVAEAGPAQTVPLGSTVQLDGSGSRDPEGDALSYRWSILSRPGGSAAVISGASLVRPTFVADVAGEYIVQLIVNDGKLDSPPDSVTISTSNSKPVANAGSDQTVNPGVTVQLDGTQSSDADGQMLLYRWALTVRPQNSNAVLSDPLAARPTFVADVAGLYLAQLTVSDGKEDSQPDTVAITAQSPGQTLNCGSNAQGSIDAPAEADTYRFSASAGSVVIVGGATADGLTAVVTELYAPNGALLQTSPADGRTGTVTLAVSGTYTAVVRSSNPQMAAGPYGVTLQFTNGQCGSAIACGQTLDGSIDLPAAHQPYRFNGNAGETIIVGAATEDGLTAVIAELYAPSGQFVAASAGDGRTNVVTLPVTGSYTLLVRSANAQQSAGQYSSTLQFTNARCGSSIVCGQTVTGLLTRPAAHTPYVFSANSGDVVLLAGATGDGLTAVISELYSPSGQLVKASLSDGTTGAVTLSQTGTYTILTRSANSQQAAGAYGVSLQFTNGTCGSSISCGQTLTGSVGTSAAHIPYRFTGAAGDTVVVAAATADGFTAAVAEVYAPSGQLLRAAAADGTTGVVTLPAAGTYTLLVKSANPQQAAGAYGVSLQFTNGSCGASIACGQTLTGSVGAAAAHIPYRFTGAAGDTMVVAAATADGLTAVVAEVYAPSGQLLRAAAADGTTGVVTLAAAGTYTLLVKSANPQQAAGAYGVSLQFTNGSCGASIACGQTLTGSVGAAAAHIPYRFTGAAGDTVVVAAATADGLTAVVAEVYAPSGQLLRAAAADGTTGVVTLAAAGTYTLLVKSANPQQAAGAYAVSLQFTKGQCAASITCGQTVSGTIAQPAAHIPYRFTGAAGNAVIVAAATAAGLTAVTAEVYAPSGQLLKAGASDGTTGVVSLTAAGTYTILVKSSNAQQAAGDYSLSLAFTQGQCGAAIACGQTLAGTLAAGTEHRPYVFSGSAGNAILLGSATADGLTATVVELYRPSGALLARSAADGSTDVTLPETGTYTALVRSANLQQAAGDYGLTLQFRTGQCATTVACGSPFGGSLTLPAARVPYRFTVGGGATVILGAATADGLTAVITDLYDPSGQLLRSTSPDGNTGSTVLPAAGTYAFLVRSANPQQAAGPYTGSLTCLGAP